MPSTPSIFAPVVVSDSLPAEEPAEEIPELRRSTPAVVWPHDRQPTHESVTANEAPGQCEAKQASETQGTEEDEQEAEKENEQEDGQEAEKEGEQDDGQEAEKEDVQGEEGEDTKRETEKEGEEETKEAETPHAAPKESNQTDRLSPPAPKETAPQVNPVRKEPVAKAAPAPPAASQLSTAPTLADNHAPTPDKSQPSLSPGAIDKRLRRVMTPRTNGSLKVPQKFVDQWRKGGAQRKTLESILASCGYDVDGICCNVYL